MSDLVGNPEDRFSRNPDHMVTYQGNSLFFIDISRVLNKVNEQYKPDVVVCQCGADGVAGDPMESFNLTPLGLGRCVQLILSWKLPMLLLGGGESIEDKNNKITRGITLQKLGKFWHALLFNHIIYSLNQQKK